MDDPRRPCRSRQSLSSAPRMEGKVARRPGHVYERPLECHRLFELPKNQSSLSALRRPNLPPGIVRELKKYIAVRDREIAELHASGR